MTKDLVLPPWFKILCRFVQKCLNTANPMNLNFNYKSFLSLIIENQHSENL